MQGHCTNKNNLNIPRGNHKPDISLLRNNKSCLEVVCDR